MRTENKNEEINSPGRPKADIDWHKVNELLIAGCSGAEISGYLGISTYTLYDRCVSDKGVMFSQYSQDKQAKGDSILRAHQYAKALGLTDKGDNTLLIWLGKTRLKQKEHTDEVITREVESKFDALMKQMKETQERSIDEIKINADNKS